MRIKWNRQLDGSLTNRPADGSELPSKEESHQNDKSHNSPKFFRIFRRKKKRQLPEDPTKNFNSDGARPCSQAPSEVDESDCASISSAATIASQPVTEVCHRDRTLSLFSSFRRSLPGGRRKSKRTVLPAPPDPLFHVEELENNRYSSPDLRKGKLESYHETKEFSKSSTFVGKGCDPPANSENAQSLNVLRAETSKSFGQLKSEITKCARQESKLSKSVSFSDCQTRTAPLVEKLQPVNVRCDRKDKSLMSKDDSYSSETFCPNSVPKSTSNGPCPPLFLPVHLSPEEVLHKSGELATAVNTIRDTDHLITDEINNFENNSNSGKDFSEKRTEVISDAKKKYFSHRTPQKHSKVSFSQIESDHDVNILKPNGNSITCHNISASDNQNSTSKKSFSRCEKSSITSESSVISDRNETVVNYYKQNHVLSGNILKLDGEIHHKNVLLNSMENFDSVVPNAIKSDHAMIINSHPSKSCDKQEEESLKCNIVNASNVWVDSSLPDTIKEICDELLAMNTEDYPVSPISYNSINGDIPLQEPVPVNGHTHLTDTCPENKVSHVSFTSSEYSNKLASKQDEIYDNFPCELIETVNTEKSVSFELPNRKIEYKQLEILNSEELCMPLDILNNTDKFKLSDNYLNINENELNLSSVGSCIDEPAQKYLIPEINIFIEENNGCNNPETINESTFEASNCKMSDFDMPWCKNHVDSYNISYREKNQERCPSYYSMSVGPAGSGVTLSESDLLKEISDTPQFSENKGGSISTENNFATVESVECSPKMLSNIEFSPENFKIDTIAALMSKDVDVSDDHLCESAPKIDLCDDEPEISDYSKYSILQSERDCTPSKVYTNAKSVRLEISPNDAEHSINPVQEMLTPVLSEYSDYFSMQDESSSVGTNFASSEIVISMNRETLGNHDRSTDVSSYPVDPTSTSISFPASPSPESIEFDESFSCDMKNVSDMFSEDVNQVFRETTECKGDTTEAPNSCVIPERNQRHIKAPTVHFAGHIETQRSRKKHLTDKDGMSLIPSLKKNRIKTCDKKFTQTRNVKVEIPPQNVYNFINRHVQEECNVPKEYVENCHKDDCSKEYSPPVDFREKTESFTLKEFLHQDLLERETHKSSLSKYKSEELFIPSNTSLEKIKNRRNSTSELTDFNTNRENASVELQEVPFKIHQLEKLPINSVEMSPKDLDNCESFCTLHRSSNATLDDLSEIYSSPHHKSEGHSECGLQTRCSSLPAVVGQPSPLKELPNDQQVNGPIRDKDAPCRKSRIPRKQTGVRGSTKPVRPPMWLSKAELTQEIQRLGTLCEARTKELNRLKMETKHVSVGFDAFAALFKYMVEDLNALSIPVLSGDLEKTLKQLELAKQDLAYYEREVEEMKAHHSQELNDLSNKLFEVYQGEITELSSKHQEELNQLNYDHQIQIENLSTAMKASSDEVQANYELMISQLKQELTTQREELQLFQDREIKDLEEKHAQATKTLQEHIEQLQKKCAELNKHSMSMEDAMRKDTDTKLQWVTSRKIDLEKEVESLKAVLEMKNKELHSLRVQTLEMEKQLEDLPLAREKIKMLQARAEDLEALMIEKTKVERKLSTENQMLKDTYEKESKVNKRLSMENEELQWRIRQAENSLLSGSFSEVAEYPESEENGAVSPIKSPTAPLMSRSVFFTFIDKDDTTSQSPRSQYKKITPGFATNYKTSPGKTNSASSPRRAKSHSEPPQPPTLSCTPRKMTKQFSSKQKSTPKRQRAGSDCGRPTSDHTEVNFSSVTGSMASSVSSESSVFEHKEQLLEEHEEQIMETLQILHEQRSIESPLEEPLTPNTIEKEWCNGEAKDTSVSPDFGNEDMSRSSEFSDPKTYYHMTFPVPKETGIVDCDTEDATKNASEESTPSLEEPANIIHSMSKSDLTQVFNSASLCSLEELSENVNVTTETISVDNMQSTQSVSHTELQEQQRTI